MSTNTTTLYNQLRSARALVEAGWSQHCLATDKAGKEVDWDSKQARCFCPIAALMRVSDDWPAEALRAYATAAGCKDLAGVAAWNAALAQTDAVLAFSLAMQASLSEETRKRQARAKRSGKKTKRARR